MGKDRDKSSEENTVEKMSIGEEFVANIPVGTNVENLRDFHLGKPDTAITTQGGIYNNPKCEFVFVEEINGNKNLGGIWSIEFVRKVEESSEKPNSDN
jgi:hypothetical protein